MLLGSGLSTAAGIPTGWDVTLDLIGKCAAASGEDCGGDPAGWYKAKYGSDADYSDLLNSLAKSAADRTNLLSGYFEPSAEDLENGLKAPTAAHKIIATLVAKGYIRLIVTTNFDRLMERALDHEGISPTVISTPDGARGAIPITHARVTVIKVNGDYRDTRIKNTKVELESYDLEMDRLLDRVFDEYGLIVCGWSATWDVALYKAFLRCPGRRFTTFWGRRKTLSDEARALVIHRQAVEIEIDSADAFFTQLGDKVDAIDRYSQPHPASAKLAVVSLKKLIAEDRHRIELRDLVDSETERLFQILSPLPVQGVSVTFDQIFDRMKLYESASEILIALVIHGAYWGQLSQRPLWSSATARIAQLNTIAGGLDILLSLRIYPACLLFYAAGISAITSNNYETLRAICRDTIINQNGQEFPLGHSLLPWRVLDWQAAKRLPGYENHHTPINDRLFDILREPLRPYLRDDSAYEAAFDRFEYLTSLIELDFQMSSKKLMLHPPVGRFGWSRVHQTQSVVDQLSKEAEAEQDNWSVITSGLFPTVARFREVEVTYRDGTLKKLQWY